MNSHLSKPILSDFETMERFLRGRTPIAASFELAIENLSRHLTTGADEESISAAFLGGVINNYPWCALMSCMDNDGVENCSWAQYKKSGKGNDAEPQSGADFALVLHREDDYVQIAIFQAKKGHLNGKNERVVDVHRISGKSEKKMSQISVLCMKSLHLESVVNPSVKSEIDKLSWVHYLCYYKDEVMCVPMSHLGVVIDHANQGAYGSYLDVTLTSDNSRPWFEVVREGVLNQTAPSWLRMKFEDAKNYLPSLLPLMDVIIVDEGKGGRHLELAKGQPVANRVIKRKDVRRSLKNKFASPAVKSVQPAVKRKSGRGLTPGG